MDQRAEIDYERENKNRLRERIRRYNIKKRTEEKFKMHLLQIHQFTTTSSLLHFKTYKIRYQKVFIKLASDTLN